MVSQVSPLAGDICDFASKAVNSRVARVTPSGVQVATLHVILLAKPLIPESQESTRPGYRLRLCTWFCWQSREFQSRKSRPCQGAGCDFSNTALRIPLSARMWPCRTQMIARVRLYGENSLRISTDLKNAVVRWWECISGSILECGIATVRSTQILIPDLAMELKNYIRPLFLYNTLTFHSCPHRCREIRRI